MIWDGKILFNPLGMKKMTEYHAVEIRGTCGCCSYSTIKVFDTLEEAQEFVGDDKNYIIEEEEDDDE